MSALYNERLQNVLLVYLQINDLWRAIYGEAFRKGDFYSDIIGCSSLSKWKAGDPIGKNTPNQIFAATTKKIETTRHIDKAQQGALLQTVEQFADRFHNDLSFDIDAAAKMLGIPQAVAHSAIYKLVYKRLPMFPQLLYDVEDSSRQRAAHSHFREYRGVWQVWLKRTDATGRRMWLLASLRVQELMEIGKGIAIQCTMNFPIINLPIHIEKFEAPPDPWFEYRGFLAVREDHLSLLFEFCADQAMGDTREDHFQIMTSLKETAPDHIAEVRGKYLTMGQGDLRDIIADELVMRRVAVTNEADIDEVMGSVHVVTDPVEVAQAESLFTNRKAHTRRIPSDA